jgi:hypothetical protein
MPRKLNLDYLHIMVSRKGQIQVLEEVIGSRLLVCSNPNFFFLFFFFFFFFQWDISQYQP